MCMIGSYVGECTIQNPIIAIIAYRVFRVTPDGLLRARYRDKRARYKAGKWHTSDWKPGPDDGSNPLGAVKGFWSVKNADSADNYLDSGNLALASVEIRGIIQEHVLGYRSHKMRVLKVLKLGSHGWAKKRTLLRKLRANGFVVARRAANG